MGSLSDRSRGMASVVMLAIARKRRLPVSLIAVDHYDVGSLIPAVDALNAERIRALRRAQAQARRLGARLSHPGARRPSMSG
jgi:hypothetical protein